MKRRIREELAVSGSDSSVCSSTQGDVGEATAAAERDEEPAVSERRSRSSSSSSSAPSDRPHVKQAGDQLDDTCGSIDFAQQTTTVIQFQTVADDDVDSLISSDEGVERRSGARQATSPPRALAERPPGPQREQSQDDRQADRSTMSQAKPGNMTATRLLQQDSGLMKKQRDAVSVHRAWTLERVAEEERREEAELARQWKELTFRPQLRQIHGHADPVAVEFTMPCHERLYKSVIHHIPPSYRPPPEPTVQEKPVINETSRQLAARRGTTQERLLAVTKPAPVELHEKKKKTTLDGSAEVADRLSKPIRRKIRTAVDEPTFRPRLTERASHLQSKKPVVDRLFKPKAAQSSS